ncbi:MAG TPA: type II toxin-antitoxin system VapC family toxin [Candidatus Limnocylindrales bacterium]|nr:type II toxin-antitoxin system VapC family toxin [Candidatus Limnocylindrales bacterium]
MIFVDSNIPMYLVGADHPNKTVARRLLEDAIVSNEPLATDAEVFQELLHRYTAISRPDAIDPAFEVLLGIVDVVHSVELEDVQKARRLLEETPRLSARDAVHGAVMQRHDIARILTFDAGFDAIAGIERLRP